LKYGTLDHIEKKIYSTLSKNGKLRYNELKNIIVDKTKACSERPFRERLNLLVENKMINRVEISRQNVHYTVDFSVSGPSNADIERMSELILYIEDRFNDLKSKVFKSSNVEKTASEIVSFAKFLGNVELQLLILENTTKHPKINKFLKKVQSLKVKTLKLPNQSPKSKMLNGFLHFILTMETFATEDVDLPKLFSKNLKKFTEIL
jgi:DNA-binding HxlR family transcriptional regulator